MATVNPFLLNTIRSLRVKICLTQEEAAVKLNISSSTLRTLEKDSTKISLDLIKKMEDLYKTPEEYIFFGRESAFSEMLMSSSINWLKHTG